MLEVVDRLQACEILGLGFDVSPTEARLRYRRLVRANHPDIIGPVGNDLTVLFNQAMAVLEIAPDETSLGTSEGQATRDDVVVIDDGLAVEMPADELFIRLAHALDVVGTLTFRDDSSGYLEAVVSLDGSPASQLVVNLQGRGSFTEASFTLESMGTETPPDLAEVVRRIRDALQRQADA